VCFNSVGVLKIDLRLNRIGKATSPSAAAVEYKVHLTMMTLVGHDNKWLIDFLFRVSRAPRLTGPASRVFDVRQSPHHIRSSECDRLGRTLGISDSAPLVFMEHFVVVNDTRRNHHHIAGWWQERHNRAALNSLMFLATQAARCVPLGAQPQFYCVAGLVKAQGASAMAVPYIEYK
jgi:hypothetical protein